MEVYGARHFTKVAFEYIIDANMIKLLTNLAMKSFIQSFNSHNTILSQCT